MKTVKFITLGCKVNQYDTQSLRQQFLTLGFKEINNHLPAGTYVINTCTVTQKADRESLCLINRSCRENPKAKIIVTGCLTELDSDKIKAQAENAVIVKNNDKDKILDFINGRMGQFFDRPANITYFKNHTRAFLKVQDGCNNFCSYCKVPLARGRSRSRPVDEVAEEAEQLANNGYKEIVICGICLGAYGEDLNPKADLVILLKRLETIPQLLRIRLSSIEAKDVSCALIKKIASSKKICRHLHIPIESGDDAILKKMNRRYCRNDYLVLIKKIKKSIPDIAVTTDILVGFPGEREESFENTVRLVKNVLPLKAHIFPFSPREGTAAYSFKNNITQNEINSRIKRLKNIAQGCALKYKSRFLGRRMDVLIEGRVKKRKGFWSGHTGNYLRVAVKSNSNLKNQIIRAHLNKIEGDNILSTP